MIQLKNLILILILVPALFVQCKSKDTKVDAWKSVNNIINHIGTITFPDTTYNIINYGAVADGKTLNTVAINHVIKKCSENGGGIVLIPKGDFFTGAIHLENNVNLRVSKEATLVFSTDPKDYLPLVKTSWEGIFCYNYSPLIYAQGKVNVAVTGKGTLHGMSKDENWWKMKGKKEYGWEDGIPCQLDPEGRPLLDQFNKNRTPIQNRLMGDGHHLRPHFIQFFECENVLIEDVTIKDSPFWVVHPILCENVTVRGICIYSNGPNSDGCDPESCKNVLIENCFFNTGDDCIALKSGRDEDGRALNKPIENVIIRNCMMRNGHGGIVLGSEISGGCKNIFAENCEMNSPDLDRAIRIKTNNNRGGVTEKIHIRNIKVGQVKEAVVRINCNYDPSEGQGNFTPLIKDIYISNLHSEKAKYALMFNGLPDTVCVKNIHIKNCHFKGAERENSILHVEDLHLDSVYVNERISL